MDLTITKGQVNDIAVAVNETSVNITQSNYLNVEVVPQAQQTIVIDRGVEGPPGPAGPNTIGGYPISVSIPSNYDALMFLSNQWTNIPQTEISDGGNF